jgi:hypothetical protein
LFDHRSNDDLTIVRMVEGGVELAPAAHGVIDRLEPSKGVLRQAQQFEVRKFVDD